MDNIIISQYLSGKSSLQIAKELNITKWIVFKTLIKHGIERRHQEHLSQENINLLLNDYELGMTIKDISIKYNRSKSSITKYLKKYGVHKPHPIYGNRKESLEPELVKQLIIDYKNGETITNLETKYDRCHGVLLATLKRNNVTIRPYYEDGRIHNINHTYFDDINTEDKAYFFGLLFADGHTRKNKRGISLRLQEEDAYILEIFKIKANIESPLYKDIRSKDNPNWSDTYFISIYSSQMAETLISYGMVPRKSLIKQFPEVILNSNEDIQRHFIRGYFDGNGSIGITYSKVDKTKIVGGYFKITTTYDMCENIRTLLYKYIDFDEESDIRIVHKKGCIYDMYSTKRKNIFKILDWIYYNCNEELMFQRKYKKYWLLKMRYNHVT